MQISRFGMWFEIFVPKMRTFCMEDGVVGRDEVLGKVVFENYDKSQLGGAVRDGKKEGGWLLKPVSSY